MSDDAERAHAEAVAHEWLDGVMVLNGEAHPRPEVEALAQSDP